MEFVIVAPIVLLLLLITLDFGRAFLQWITINNMARVGASYAATNPDGWPANPAKQATYATLITANSSGLDCALADAAPPPTFGATRNPGDLVRVDLTCSFRIITPLVGEIVGSNLQISASSTFPITAGCLANCGSGPPAPPPGGSGDDGCRTVPALVGLSVDGARGAWVAAGFAGANFTPSTGEDARTVASQAVTPGPEAIACAAGQAFFTSAVDVQLVPVTPPPVGATCVNVPNLIGSTVANARTNWEAAGFLIDGFVPAADFDDQIVTAQITEPESQPGDCREPDTTISITHGPPPAPPPPPPCKVPSLVNTNTATATDSWTAAGFAAESLIFRQPNSLDYEIRSQSLVGNTYIGCSAMMAVSRNTNVDPPP